VNYLDYISGSAIGPSYGSVDSARAVAADLSDEEYALARVVASEYASGSAAELCCLGDATINDARAAGRELGDYITAGSSVFGGQGTTGAFGRKRPVSSARAPGPRHIRAALALLRARLFGLADPPARGIARGARRYFDGKTQLAQSRISPSTHCHPLVILERWTYALPWGSARCTLGTVRGRDQQEWVGPISGVDAWQLMLFRPAGRQQGALYAAARRVIESEGGDGAGPPLGPVMPIVELLVVVVVAAAAAMALTGGRGAWV
jgi:hypothetical protein